MRRNIVHPGADSLTYEIRSIVAIGRRIQSMGVDMVWENIGDPIAKGEKIVPWIKEKTLEVMNDDSSWGYCDSKGVIETRDFLAKCVNDRGGAQINSEDILFFNGLGDAISKIFSEMRREARILGPVQLTPPTLLVKLHTVVTNTSLINATLKMVGCPISKTSAIKLNTTTPSPAFY